MVSDEFLACPRDWHCSPAREPQGLRNFVTIDLDRVRDDSDYSDFRQDEQDEQDGQDKEVAGFIETHVPQSVSDRFIL